jgi:imidazolonepropionase-like amidohydrolase
MSQAEDGGRELPLRAAAAVSEGLSSGEALLALTSRAARLYGLEDRVGSLEVGKDGDVLVWSGPPFELTSRLEAVLVGGRVIDEED